MSDHSTPTHKLCPVCGKPARPTYCSAACHAKTRRRGEQRQCLHCGKSFYLRLSDKLKGSGVFCSQACRCACKREFDGTSANHALPPLPQQDGVEFRPVAGNPAYCIGTDGSLFSRWTHDHTSGNRLGDRWHKAKAYPTGDGYVKYWISGNGVRQAVFAHKLVLLAFVGECPPGMQCRHLDGNRANNWVWNLCWGTPRENSADAIAHGTIARGTRHSKNKLSVRDVREIRRRRAAGESVASIARSFHVSQVCASRVSRHLSWAWLDKED